MHLPVSIPQMLPLDHDFFRGLQSVMSFLLLVQVPFPTLQINVIKQILLANIFALWKSQTFSQLPDQSDVVYGSLYWNT